MASAMTPTKPEDAKLRQIWNNQDGYRFVPRANGKGVGNWDVFDKKEQRFLSRSEVAKCNPHERLTQ